MKMTLTRGFSFSSPSSTTQEFDQHEVVSNFESWDDIPLTDSSSPSLEITNSEDGDDHYINDDQENITITDDLDSLVRVTKKRSPDNMIERDEAESKKLKTSYGKDAETIQFLEDQIARIELRDSAGPPSLMKRSLEDLDESSSKRMKMTGILEYENDRDHKLFKLLLDYYEKEGTYPVQRGNHVLNFILNWVPSDFIRPNLVEREIFSLMLKYFKVSQYKRRNPGILLSPEDQIKLEMFMIWKKNPCYISIK